MIVRSWDHRVILVQFHELRKTSIMRKYSSLPNAYWLNNKHDQIHLIEAVSRYEYIYIYNKIPQNTRLVYNTSLLRLLIHINYKSSSIYQYFISYCLSCSFISLISSIHIQQLMSTFQGKHCLLFCLPLYHSVYLHIIMAFIWSCVVIKCLMSVK